MHFFFPLVVQGALLSANGGANVSTGEILTGLVACDKIRIGSAVPCIPAVSPLLKLRYHQHVAGGGGCPQHPTYTKLWSPTPARNHSTVLPPPCRQRPDSGFHARATLKLSQL